MTNLLTIQTTLQELFCLLIVNLYVYHCCFRFIIDRGGKILEFSCKYGFSATQELFWFFEIMHRYQFQKEEKISN